jgi:predicted Rossmann fold nucleotide-binding protein DprA/Smf involved in DNA uptake
MLISEGYAKMWQADPSPEIRITKSDDPLLAVLEGDGLTANDIARRLGKPVSEIGAQLSLLSVTGQLTEQGGKYYLNYVDQN